MRITWNWLAEFVELQAPPPQLADRLTMAGFEVDAIEEPGRDLLGIVCAEIVEVRPHPAADRLRLCDVRTVLDGVTQVVCGAPNVQAGSRVAYAAPGVTLPGGRRIEVVEVRGVSSAGMLCSAAELGIGPDAEGILLLPPDAPIGQRVGAILGLEDTVLDVVVTPNRGDCLSILGMAREIAALTGKGLLRQRIAVREADEASTDLIAIRVADADLCGRYVGRVLSNLKIAPSPPWMQFRLQAVGIRPINNVVDVTNYVMIERGQPLHAFDYDRLPGKEIVVRRAGDDREFTTLDEQCRRLDAEDLLITSGGRPVAIAGIMGGVESEVTSDTRRILLESAWFAPATVRRTAKRLGLRTEASFRFERTTDIDGVAVAADRAAVLISKLANADTARGRVDAYPGARPPAPIALRLKRVDDLLGVSVSRQEVVSRLKALGLGVSPATRGTLTAVPPSYRTDLTREVDLIEEIARVGGYESLPTTLPESALIGPGQDHQQRRQRDLKRLLVGLGLSEAVLLSFSSSRSNVLFPGLHDRRSAVTLRNPIAQDEPDLRLSLLPGLLRAACDNRDQGISPVALFSLGKVFWRGAERFAEAPRLAAVVCPSVPSAGVGSRSGAAEFADVKGLVESVLGFLAIRDVAWVPATDLPAFHPGKTARIETRRTTLGVLGCLHPDVEEECKIDGPCWLFELDMERLLEYCPAHFTYRDLSRFPAVVRDVAIVTGEDFASDQVVQFVREWNQTVHLIEDVHLFDQYTGQPIPPGHKSLAYSLAYRAADRTLTDAEVNEVHARLIAALKDVLHVEPR